MSLNAVRLLRRNDFRRSGGIGAVATTSEYRGATLRR